MSPSYRIVFYISGHGFGHASRSIEVIHALLRLRPDVRIVVKTAAPLQLFTRTLHGQCELLAQTCDAGVVQIDSLAIDPEETLRTAVEFQRRLPALAVAEAGYLRKTGAQVAVGDIPPLAVAAADAAGVPSLIFGNFTWDWIYDGLGGEAARGLGREIRRAYAPATVALRLPMAGGFDGLARGARDIPFIARRSQHSQDAVRRALGLPPRAGGKPLVLMSFGGHGVTGIDTGALAGLSDFTIAVTEAPSRHLRSPPPKGLLALSEQRLYEDGLRYEDLVRGADVVVTKPGYGIISEAIANDTALLYTSRPHFVEYDVLVREMPRYLRAQFIEPERLLSGDWSAALQQLLSQGAPQEKPPVNGADVAAGEILELAARAATTDIP
jgi:L-arabinokinase